LYLNVPELCDSDLQFPSPRESLPCFASWDKRCEEQVMC